MTLQQPELILLMRKHNPSEFIAEGYLGEESDIKNIRTFDMIKQQYRHDKK